MLKKINSTTYKGFTREFNIKTSISWHDKIIKSINNSLSKIKREKLASEEFIEKIKEFVKKNNKTLDEQRIALVYWDAHFDNILVKDDKIVGILDFERTELASIDFTLDIIKRMVEYPKKYMSKESEKFARKRDYANLLKWFKEFYPELFRFKSINTRLDLYSMEHSLKDLIYWPNCSEEIKREIEKVISN